MSFGERDRSLPFIKKTEEITVLKSLSITVIIASIMFLCPLIAYADGVNYMGEVCLKLTSDYNDAPYYVPDKTVQLGILSYGAGYFSLNGKITEENSKLMPALGTAIITAFNGDNKVVLTLTAADGTFAYSEIFYITFDLKTLSGAFSSIVHEELFFGAPPTPDQIGSRYDKGDASLVVCPK